MFRNAPILLAVTFFSLLAVVGANTWFILSKQLVVPPAAPITVDGAAAALRLGAAVRLKTVSSAEDADANGLEFLALHEHLRTCFPKAHAALKLERVGTYSLLYAWPGTDPNMGAVALLAHQDVVPIAPGTDTDWSHPPFSGDVADGFIWGRGAWDNKGNLMAIMEAVELLAASGFQPRQNTYLVFGHDEEVGGTRGAQQVVNVLKQRGVHLDFVLDEGLLVVQGLMSGIDGPVALIGVAEKGYLTLQLSARAPPGHASMPPVQAEQTAIGIMSAALSRLEASPMPGGLDGVATQLFDTLAPEMTGRNRVFLANRWLFSPAVAYLLDGKPSTRALLRTTTALTVFHAGNKDNVLPGLAEATVNFRIRPGDSIDTVVRHTERVLNNDAITITQNPNAAEPSPVSSTDSPGYRAINTTLRQLHPGVVVAPSLMLGGTDARHFSTIAENIYRFSPVRAVPQDLARFHGTNERLSVANHTELIQFYHQLLRNLSTEQTPGRSE